MLRKGIVVDVHPEDYSVDLVMADDGARLVGVQVLTGNGSSRTGVVDLPKMPARANKWDITKEHGWDMEAVVGFMGRVPFVMGFLYPQINQMVFNDPERRVERHQSDVYKTIDGRGNIELFHPSGTFVRIAETPEHEDLSGKNTDSKMGLDKNTDKKVYVRVHMAGGAAVLTIAPDGAVKLTTKTTMDFESDGDMTFKSGTHMIFTAPRIDWN